MTITTADLATPPAGYSFYKHPNMGDCIWSFIQYPNDIVSVDPTSVDALVNIYNAFKRDTDGNIVVNPAGIERLRVMAGFSAVRLIPDAEFPEGGMTYHHSHFNPTTRKFEFAHIAHAVHKHHERTHDADVMSAVAALCGVELHLMHKAASLVGLNAANTEKANGKYADFDSCLDDIVAANAEGALEHAWIKSLGVIRHTGRDNPEVEFVTAAHDFAAAYIGMIDGKTEAQLAARRYQYTTCLFAALRNDAGKKSGRFLPRGVKLVESKSSPADAAEVTLSALYRKLKSRVAPAEGPAKQT